MGAIYPNPGSLKGIQRGTILLSGVATATATISAVNTAKSSLTLLGSYGSTNVLESMVRIDLTNATTITASRGINTGSALVSWELREVY